MKPTCSCFLQIFVHCNAKYYTGIPGEELASFEHKIVLNPKKGKQQELFLSEVNNRETIAAIDAHNDMHCLLKQI